ncbi:MAG: hypothetical protein WBB28_22155 [Crinalium sp.]
MNKITDRAYLFHAALLVGIPLTVLIAYFGLNYSGFCFAEMRYLSDIEKIKSVFNYQIEHRIPERIINQNQKEKLYTYIGTKNFEEYVKENPDCCTINPGGPYEIAPPSFLDRITGYNSGDVVVINFKGHYLDKNGKQEITQYQAAYFLLNCGKVKGG